MNRLQLVQRLCQEAGISSSGPSTTISQTGQSLQAVNWIDSAYERIQEMHQNWDFLRADFTHTTSSPTIILPDFGSWKEDSFRCYLTATGTDDEQFLEFIPWDTFRDTYYYGTTRSQTGRPSMISVKPNTDLLIYPTADDTYTIVGEYFKKPDTMTLDADVPLFAKHHMAIVWKALMLYAGYSSEPDKYTHGYSEFKPLIRKLELSQLPKMSWGPTFV